MKNYMDDVLDLIDLSENRPLNELVYEGLRKAIISGIIPVGEHINEKVYADYLNISRTPMRRAIDRLKNEDIIHYIPNFGVVVKRVTQEDAVEIYKIRTALDTLATITAADLMDDDDHKAMEELLRKTRVVHDEGDVKKTIAYFSDFNASIYKNARMPRLKIVVKQLQEYLSRFRDISLEDDYRREVALVEHEQISQLLKIGDKEAIEILVENHLKDSRDFVIGEILRVEQEMKDSIKK